MKQQITNASIFLFAITSSLLLLLSVTYGQKIFSDYWVLHAFVQLSIILFFGAITSWAMLFWVTKNGKHYKTPYVPLLINATAVIIIIVLPLNWLRNHTEFKLNKVAFEQAAAFVLNKKIKYSKYPQICELPEQYKFLSLDGVVLVIYEQNSMGVFFYTFRGAPHGTAGFLKIFGDEPVDVFHDDIAPEDRILKNLDNHWYFISGE